MGKHILCVHSQHGDIGAGFTPKKKNKKMGIFHSPSRGNKTMVVEITSLKSYWDALLVLDVTGLFHPYKYTA